MIAFISSGVSPALSEIWCLTGLVLSKVKVAELALTSLSQLTVEALLDES